MKAFIGLILWFSVHLIILSQTIEGYVFSEKDKQPFEFANVAIYLLPDTVYKAGIVSYLDGKYSADNIKPGKYLIKASFVGYENSEKVIEVENKGEIIIIDTLFLIEKISEIEGVQVTADLIRGEELVDRTTYSIPPEIEKTSANGYDVLKKIPSVQVDFNNNITLNGKSNFIVQVDGKQRDSEFLARILPSQIKTIEVIHNPSGKYDGTIEGVINIILKKEARMGINGNVYGAARPSKDLTAFAMGGLDYGLEKVTFYFSGYTVYQGLESFTTRKMNFSIMDGLESRDSVISGAGNGNFVIGTSSLSSGCDIYLNDKNNLSFNFTYRPTNLDMTGRDENLVEGEEYNQIYENGNKSLSDEYNASVFYRKKFKKPIQELTFESSLYYFDGHDQNDFLSLMTYPSGIPGLFPESLITDTILQVENVFNERMYQSNKIDYVHPIGISVRVEAGYQFYYQEMEYRYESKYQLPNDYNYGEIRNAAYASAYWNLKDFGFNGTLRIERSDIVINDSINSGYWTFLPSVNIQYKINPQQNLKFTYNRRISRPGTYQLNPFSRLNNDQSISSGNPYLKPEYRDRLQLTYTLNFKKNFISPSVYYEILSNRISNINTLIQSPFESNLIQLSAPENVISGYETGIGFNAVLWSINLNGAIYKLQYNEYSDADFSIDKRENLSFRFSAYGAAPLFKEKLHVFGLLTYNGVRIEAQSKIYSAPIYGVGAQKIYKDHTLRIMYLLPFTKELTYEKTVLKTENLSRESAFGFNTAYYFQIMYAYKFNKGKVVKKIGRNVRVESDSKSGGIGQQ